MQGLRLKPRTTPLVLPFAAFGLTILSSVIAVTNGSIEKVVPFASLPMLLVFGYMVFPRKPPAVTVRFEDERLRIDGFERQTLVFEPRESSLRRWVVSVLGTRHGDALLVRGVSPDGKDVSLTFGASGAQLARATDEPCEQVDISLDPPDFTALTDALLSRHDVASRGRDDSTSFALVPHRGTTAVLGQMLPWFATMLGVGLLGVLGEPLMQTAPGRIVLFTLIVGALGAGIFYTIRRSTRPKREVLLRVTRTNVSIEDGNQSIFRAPLPELKLKSEIYVYATKYGTYRFPVLVLKSGSTDMRIGVWEDYSTVGMPLAPEGAAPTYLVSAPELRKLSKLLSR